MNFPLIRKILGLSVGGALVVSAVAGLLVTGIAYATQQPGAPDVQVRLGDDMNDSTPELPQDCPRDTSRWVGHGDGVANLTTGGVNDADCIQVQILNSSLDTQYTSDFQLCLGIPYNSACTPWASQGGGFSGQVTNGTGNIKGAQLWVNTRSMPVTGMKVDRVQAGVQFYYQKNNNACRGSSGMAWSSGSPSGWAYGERQDNDPGCARIGLMVRQVLPPNAQYVSDTIPRTADPSTTYQASITMKNKGMTWDSDRIIVPESNDCIHNVPNNGDVCHDSYVVESSNFVLARTSSTASELQAPSTLPYRRTISVTYTHQMGEECEFEPGGGGCSGGLNGYIGGRSRLSRVFDQILPSAYALPCGPGGGGGTTICTTYDYISRVETPVRDIYYDVTATFPITVTTPSEAGSYRWEYQMADRRDIGNPFGEKASGTIEIGNTGGIGLSCTTLSRTVVPGDPADYGVSVSGTGGFAGQVTVGLSPTSTVPDGVTAAPATVTLPPSPQNGLVVLMTSSSTPRGTYPITFRATAQGVAPKDCNAELIVDNSGEATLRVDPLEQHAMIGGPDAHFEAWYDADGPNGPATERRVTDPADWFSDIPGVATATGAGTFRGTATGTTQIWASYAGLQAGARLNVDSCPDPGCTAGSYIEMVPPSAETYVGAEAHVRAIYHAYPGAEGSDVTADSYWASGSNGIASVCGDGCFLGRAVGFTSMNALYPIPETNPVQYLSASGDLAVRSNEDARLTVEPGSTEIQVGSTATYAAYYDPDGNGPEDRQPVTGLANWSSTCGTSLGNGVFRGDQPCNGSVQASYAGLSAAAGLSVTNGSGQCTFTANPTRLFIPPARSSTLTWQCQQPTSCTINNVTDSVRVTQGGQNGTAPVTPSHSTNYRLSCDNGFQGDAQVRVFDVSTRIEILPQ